MHEDEIADARRHGETETFQRAGRPFQPAGIVVDGALDEGALADRRGARGDGGGVEVERSAHPVQRIDDRLRPVHPADPQTRKAVDLGEGAGHHDVFGGRDQLDAGAVIIAPDIFGIGRVEDENDIAGQAGMQPPHLVEGQIGAGRIVRIGEEDQLRPVGDGGEDRVDIGGGVGLLHRDRRRAARQDLDAVDQEAVLGVDRLVAGRQIALAQKPQQLVRTVAAQDMAAVETVDLGDGVLEGGGLAVGIDLELRQRGHGRLARRRRRSERRLVRRQLVQRHAGRRLALAGDIGLDVEDALGRNGSHRPHSFAAASAPGAGSAPAGPTRQFNDPEDAPSGGAAIRGSVRPSRAARARGRDGRQDGSRKGAA